MAFGANLVKVGYFSVETSLNKYIELRKGESVARKKAPSVKHPLRNPNNLADLQSPRKGRRRKTNSLEVVL